MILLVIAEGWGFFCWPESRFPGSDITLSHLIRMIEDHGWSGDNMADRRQLFVEMSEYLEAEPSSDQQICSDIGR